MKQRFLNQKLGKRNSRRTELQKAKAVFSQSRNRPMPRPTSPSTRETPAGKES
jgi:hypothetical protein